MNDLERYARMSTDMIQAAKEVKAHYQAQGGRDALGNAVIAIARAHYETMNILLDHVLPSDQLPDEVRDQLARAKRDMADAFSL